MHVCLAWIHNHTIHTHMIVDKYIVLHMYKHMHITAHKHTHSYTEYTLAIIPLSLSDTFVKPLFSNTKQCAIIKTSIASYIGSII